MKLRNKSSEVKVLRVSARVVGSSVHDVEGRKRVRFEPGEVKEFDDVIHFNPLFFELVEDGVDESESEKEEVVEESEDVINLDLSKKHLSRAINGVGEELAELIVEKFGEESDDGEYYLHVDNLLDLSEQELIDLPGVGEVTAKKIRKQINEVYE